MTLKKIACCVMMSLVPAVGFGEAINGYVATSEKVNLTCTETGGFGVSDIKMVMKLDHGTTGSLLTVGAIHENGAIIDQTAYIIVRNMEKTEYKLASFGRSDISGDMREGIYELSFVLRVDSVDPVDPLESVMLENVSVSFTDVSTTHDVPYKCKVNRYEIAEGGFDEGGFDEDNESSYFTIFE